MTLLQGKLRLLPKIIRSQGKELKMEGPPSAEKQGSRHLSQDLQNHREHNHIDQD
uniref:Uncharacterized protein n=1 Tax=Arundo donax TaxID=35708 RepID=A0A0A9EJC8_ARUDO